MLARRAEGTPRRTLLQLISYYYIRKDHLKVERWNWKRLLVKIIVDVTTVRKFLSFAMFRIFARSGSSFSSRANEILRMVGSWNYHESLEIFVWNKKQTYSLPGHVNLIFLIYTLSHQLSHTKVGAIFWRIQKKRSPYILRELCDKNQRNLKYSWPLKKKPLSQNIKAERRWFYWYC